MNGSSISSMDFKPPIQGPWPKRFEEHQIYLQANTMAIQLSFIAIPIMLGLVAFALMVLVPTSFGRTAGIIVGTAIFPSLGVCWWLGRMMQPTHFVVYEGEINSLGTQAIFEHERPIANVQVERMYHLSAKGLHSIEKTQNNIDIPITQTEHHLIKRQSAFLVCLQSGELIVSYPISST